MSEDIKMIEGSAQFLCAAVELAMGRIDLCKCSECGGPRDNGWSCGECDEGYCDPITEDCHSECAIQAISQHDTLTNQVKVLKEALNKVISMSYDSENTKQTIEIYARKALKAVE